jgi:hypothetical protein
MTAAFAWPAVVVVLVIFFVVMFRQQIARLISRGRKIGVAGASFEMDSDAAALEAASAQARIVAAEVFEGIADSVYLASRRKQLEEALSGRGLVGAEREKYLIRGMSLVGAAWDHEVTYRLVFGSPLTLLQQLTAGALSRDILLRGFAFVQEEDDWHKGRTVDEWLQFLVTREVIQLREGGAAEITLKGRDFLKYLIDAAIPLHRPH